MLKDSFKKIANAAPSMLWVSDIAKNYIFFNKAWLEFRGTTLDEEIAVNCDDAIFPQDLPGLLKKFDKSFNDRKPYKAEYRLMRHDGTFRWVIENGTPLYDDNNRFAGYIGSCSDIHNIKELERRKEDFVIAASHELKTPLTSLSVYLHLIDEYFQERKLEEFQNYSNGAIIQLNKISSLIDQLLDLNKIRSGSLDYKWSEFLLHELLSDIIDKTRMLYPERSIRFVNQSTAGIRGDTDRLSQAIENLLSNAIKYSDKNEHILVETEDQKSFILVRITDFGIGIDPAYQNKIFERFFRIPGQQEQTYPGMGMGLYLARKIVEKHNGKISVESRKNEHTRFSIKLPILT